MPFFCSQASISSRPNFIIFEGFGGDHHQSARAPALKKCGLHLWTSGDHAQNNINCWCQSPPDPCISLYAAGRINVETGCATALVSRGHDIKTPCVQVKEGLRLSSVYHKHQPARRSTPAFTLKFIHAPLYTVVYHNVPIQYQYNRLSFVKPFKALKTTKRSFELS